MNAKKLHQLALNWDWDAEDIDRMVSLLNQPQCSLGTALLFYWGMCPHYYRQYRDRADVPDFEQKNFDVLSIIEERIAHHQYQHHGIAYDPSCDPHGINCFLVGYPDVPHVRSLPEWMYIATIPEGIITFDPAEIERQITLLPKRERPDYGKGLQELFEHPKPSDD
jgi:Domain of unknown function (DUF4274)